MRKLKNERMNCYFSFYNFTLEMSTSPLMIA